MLTVKGKVDVRCTIESAWDLFSRFEDIAALIPTVEDVEVDGEHIHAVVCTKLGALPITSRVTLKVVEAKQYESLKAEGLSYLGETIKEQIKKDVAGVAKDAAGRLFLHLVLRASETAGVIAVLYTADVEAKGRLKRIYKAILKTKVPAMMEEFANNLRDELERAEVPDESSADEPARPVDEARSLQMTPEPSVSVEEESGAREPRAEPEHEETVQPAHEEPRQAAIVPARVGLWARLVAWLRRTVGLLWRSS